METVIKVRGMTCMHCVATVKQTLEQISGVRGASPDLPSGTVHVEGHEFDRKKLFEAIAEAGYEPLDS
jgi:copper chaperone